MNKNDHALLEPKRKVEARNNKDYKIEAIINSTVYEKETNDQKPGFYYLVL